MNVFCEHTYRQYIPKNVDNLKKFFSRSIPKMLRIREREQRSTDSGIKSMPAWLSGGTEQERFGILAIFRTSNVTRKLVTKY